MSKPNPQILLFLIRQTLYRVDLGKPFLGPSSVEELVSPSAQSPMQLLVSQLSSLKHGKRVLLFWDAAWCQEIDLPSGSVSGLKEPEITTALSFEAETFSGLRSDETLCAWRSSGSQNGINSYLVMQMERNRVEEVAQAMKTARLSFCGISHPAFVGLQPTDGETAEAIAAAVSSYLEKKSVPVLLPPQAPRSQYLPCWIGVAVGVLLAVGLTLFHLHQRTLFQRYRSENRTLGNLNATRTRLTDELKRIRTETESAQQAFQTEKENARKITITRGVLSGLCDALAQSCPPSSMIREIEPVAPFALRIEGWCCQPKDTEKFFSSCAERVAKLGWKLRPEEITAKGETMDGGPWKFAFILHHPDQVIEEVGRFREPSEDDEENW